MAENSKIEWTHHTFSAWRGCTKVSPGCANCYAEKMSGRNPGTLGEWGPNGTRIVAAEDYWALPAKWNKWAAAGVCHACGGRGLVKKQVCESCDGNGLEGDGSPYRAKVFSASISDVFEDWTGPMLDSKGERLCVYKANGGILRIAPYAEEPHANCRWFTMQDARETLFKLIDATPNLDWLLLTKRPENIAKMMPAAPQVGSNYHIGGGTGAMRLDVYRDNVWLGTSLESQAQTPRVEELLKIPAKVRFLSMEPLLGAVELKQRFTDGSCSHRDFLTGQFHGMKMTGANGNPDALVSTEDPRLPRIGWVIVGGESGHGARPMHPDWVRSLRDQCLAATVPFFFKQWGEWKPISEMDEAEWNPLYKSRRVALPDQDQAALDDIYGRDCTVPTRQFQFDGHDGAELRAGHSSMMLFRIGKKAAGRLLDGREWSEFPEVRS